MRPCKLLHKERDSATGEVMYTAQMLNNTVSKLKEKVPEGVEHIVTGIPREAIMLKDKAYYHSDQRLPNVFRHEIGIPTEIFPKQWMDLTD